jgi:hypothetical protein
MASRIARSPEPEAQLRYDRNALSGYGNHLLARVILAPCIGTITERQRPPLHIGWRRHLMARR